MALIFPNGVVNDCTCKPTFHAALFGIPTKDTEVYRFHLGSARRYSNNKLDPRAHRSVTGVRRVSVQCSVSVGVGAGETTVASVTAVVFLCS